VTPLLELAAPVVLAHGGGVPEAAAIGLPLLALVLFAVFERRARRRERGEQDDG
jgi:hypothetical protein